MGDANLKKGLDQATSALLKVARVVHPGWNGKSKLKNNLKPDGLTPKSIFTIVEGVHAAFTGLIEAVKLVQEEKCPKVTELQETVKDLESDLDAAAQKSKTGTIILTQPKEVNLIKSEETIKAGGRTVEEHACELINMKTGVAVDEKELNLAHYLPNGNIKVRFSDRKAGSKFSQVAEKIKKPSREYKDVKVYANFELTKKRSAILYEIRRLKRENKVHRFYTDFDGSISLIPKEGDDKVKVTRNSGRSGGRGERRAGKQPLRTLSALEICRRYDPDFVDPEVEKEAANEGKAEQSREGSGSEAGD